MSKKEDDIRKKRREDKIFNNGYKSGEGFRDEEDYEYQTSISVDASYSDSYLKDIYDYEEHLDYSLGLDRIFELIETDKDLNGLLHKIKSNERIKLSKEEINWCFKKVIELIEADLEQGQFYNPIYVMEALSSIININSQDSVKDYKKIFDALDVELQEELIVELNKKYNFLDGKMVKRKMH